MDDDDDDELNGGGGCTVGLVVGVPRGLIVAETARVPVGRAGDAVWGVAKGEGLGVAFGGSFDMATKKQQWL